ncbi:copper transporter [Chiua virens]|nr:copper transporter [Chiua virens]
MTTGMMTPWLHFGNTDYLIFKAWRPSSHGAIAGASMGLFLCCILERGLAAYRRAQELRWSAKAILLSSGVHPSSGKKHVVETSGDRVILTRRFIPPFRSSRDIPRGIIQAIQSMFAYILMLSVMTFNAAYIISIILGLGVGEDFSLDA